MGVGTQRVIIQIDDNADEVADLLLLVLHLLLVKAIEVLLAP